MRSLLTDAAVSGSRRPTAGSPLLAFVIALVLALGAVSLGIFLSTFARTEFRIPQPVARVLPLAYAVEGLRKVIIAGAVLASAPIQLDLAVLVGIAAFFVIPGRRDDPPRGRTRARRRSGVMG